MFFMPRLSLWTISYRTPWCLVVRLSHVDQSGNFVYKNKTEFMIFLFTHHPTRATCYLPLEKSHAMSLGYKLSLIKFCDPSCFYFVYALDSRLYIQMKPMLLKYYLTIVFKKKEREKRWHAKEAWPKKRERERGKMAYQRSMNQQINSDMKRSM